MRTGLVDTIFSNTDEVLSLYETPDTNAALQRPARRRRAWRRDALGKRLDRAARAGDARSPRLPYRPRHRYDRRGRSVRRGISCRHGARRAIMSSARGLARWPRPKSSSISAPGLWRRSRVWRLSMGSRSSRGRPRSRHHKLLSRFGLIRYGRSNARNPHPDRHYLCRRHRRRARPCLPFQGPDRHSGDNGRQSAARAAEGARLA